MTKQLKNEDYIQISARMVNELGLGGIDLQIYAIIYGYSKDGKSKFYGGLKYLELWTGATVNTVQSSLKRLIERGLIGKEDIYENNVKYCRYKNIYDTGYVKNGQGVYQNLTGGISKFDNNNKYIINNIDNKTTNSLNTQNQSNTDAPLNVNAADLDKFKELLEFYPTNNSRAGNEKQALKEWQSKTKEEQDEMIMDAKIYRFEVRYKLESYQYIKKIENYIKSYRINNRTYDDRLYSIINKHRTDTVSKETADKRMADLVATFGKEKINDLRKQWGKNNGIKL